MTTRIQKGFVYCIKSNYLLLFSPDIVCCNHYFVLSFEKYINISSPERLLLRGMKPVQIVISPYILLQEGNLLATVQKLLYANFNLFIYLVFSEDPVTNRRKYKSSNSVYYHCHIWPPYYYVSYTVCRIGLKGKVGNFRW